MPSKRKIRVVVTAGPTREMIDPVRFLSNVSTGLMGYLVAAEAKRLGFDVTLISGPAAFSLPRGVRMISILSVRDLKQALYRCWPTTDILIMTAAVCDYAPIHFSRRKIKRITHKTIRFKRTPDLLAFFGKRKGRRLMIGFSLETEAAERNALRKLREKNLDLIVINWYGRKNNPFGKSRFSFKLMDSAGRFRLFRNRSKPEAAKLLIRAIDDLIHSKAVENQNVL